MLRTLLICGLAGLPALLLATAEKTALGQSSFSVLPDSAYGQHDVGFRTLWQRDDSRTWRTAFDDGETWGQTRMPRPLLVNLWYPATARTGQSTMRYGDYLTAIRSAGQWKRLSAALSEFARGIVVEEVLGKPETELDEGEAAWLKRFLNAPTRSNFQAQPVAGRFPIIVWHSGAGSSYEDNSVLCELLASHGYIVIGSAFLKGDGSSLRIDGGHDSVADIAFLAQYAATHAGGDREHVALVGHSAGAQAHMKFLSRPSHQADAAVLLDTTLDYYSHQAVQTTWRRLAENVTANAESVDCPLLVVAGPQAAFGLVDRLVFAERTYLTVPELDHNDFISQGVFKNGVRSGTADQDPQAEETDRRQRITRNYGKLCRYLVVWLDAKLKGREPPLREINQRLARNRPGNDELRVELTPRNQDAPPPYLADSGQPPTPRQLLHLIPQVGVDETIEILQQFADHEPKSPIYGNSMLLGSLLYGLIRDGKQDEARTLFDYLVQGSPNVLSGMTFPGDMCALLGRLEDAERYYRAALTLQPEDARILQKLSDLKKKQSGQ